MSIYIRWHQEYLDKFFISLQTRAVFPVRNIVLTFQFPIFEILLDSSRLERGEALFLCISF